MGDSFSSCLDFIFEIIYSIMQLSNKPCSDTKDINLLGSENESLFIIYKSPYFVVL